jgi:hypothetical protein
MLKSIFTFIADWIREMGILIFLSVSLALGGLLMLVSMVTNSIPQGAIKFIPAELLYVVPSGLLVAASVFGYFGFRLKRKHDLQIIAWAGYEDSSIYSRYKGKLAFLLYRRGPVHLARFNYQGDEFDVLISDLELLKRHHATERLEDLHDLNGLLSGFAGLVRRAYHDAARSGSATLGIPIRFGFNEILVNSNRIPVGLKTQIADKLDSCSYTDFQLAELIKHSSSNSRIGLYAGYLPTLSTLLMTQGIALDAVEAQDGAVLQSLVSLIVSNYQKFQFLETPSEVYHSLDMGLAWIVLGAGSWIIPNTVQAKQSMRIVLPEEGVLMWTECGTVLRNIASPRAKAHHLIKYWLEKDTQKQLSYGRIYGGCPVLSAVLTEVYGEHPATPTLEKWTLSAAGAWDARDESKIHQRKLPEHWRQWENLWESVEKHVQG